MLAALLLAVLLGQTPMPTHVDAAALARDGHYDAALDAFRRIAAANPRDHEARVWIARLHGWMGNPELAEPVYRSIVLEDPANIDATFGLGLTLVELGRTEEGIEMLERAETAQPQNADILAGLGRAHAMAGRNDIAVLYAERAVLLSPTDARRQTFEQARLIQGHRVEITSFGERYNVATPNTGSVDLRVNFRLREQLRLIGRGQHQRKFNASEQRGGGGLEWQWRAATSLFGQVLIGPGGNAVLPRVDVRGEIAHTEGPTQWVAGYRFFDFPGAQVSVISPGVTWWPTDRTWVAARYYLSLTDFSALTRVQKDHSVGFRAAYQVARRVWLNAGYARGTENFDTLSPDRIGAFRANTASGGVRLDLPSLTSVQGLYEHQWRPRDVEMRRFTVSLLQRF